MSIMNMPPLTYLRRIPGLDTETLRGSYTDSTVWDALDEAIRWWIFDRLSLDGEVEVGTDLPWDDPDPLRTTLTSLFETAASSGAVDGHDRAVVAVVVLRHEPGHDRVVRVEELRELEVRVHGAPKPEGSGEVGELALHGPGDQRARAVSGLETLYQRLESGRQIEQGRGLGCQSRRAF